jgi:RNA-directed DNA polymerase
VRSSGLASPSAETNRSIRKFDESWITNLERISSKLREGKFNFGGEKGVPVPKGKGKLGFRPLVLAPIENRIVRRAILEVLQGYGDDGAPTRSKWSGIPSIVQIMETRTSVGGIRERGVPHGLALIDQAIREGHYWFIRSDIQNFFTRIPLSNVNSFVRKSVSDQQFADLFESALATNLTNRLELEERQHFLLFPDSETGVAQGSALSALAGNIALRHFDEQMNGREIVCVRYIDDFILLGRSQVKVRAAFASAQRLLARMGMDVYAPTDAKALKGGKVDAGNIHNGTDVLGYRISAGSRQPCAAAQKTLLLKLDKVVADAKREMGLAADGKSSSSHLHRYHQSMVMLHKIAWGWSQSFRHTTARHVFEALDDQIDRRIAELRTHAFAVTRGATSNVRRRVAGTHLLADTEFHPLPEIPKFPSPNANEFQAALQSSERVVGLAVAQSAIYLRQKGGLRLRPKPAYAQLKS